MPFWGLLATLTIFFNRSFEEICGIQKFSIRILNKEGGGNGPKVFGNHQKKVEEEMEAEEIVVMTHDLV